MNTQGNEPMERIQKLISRAGLGSRRSAEKLIEEGRVTLDGRVVKLGDKASVDQATIAVDGEPLPLPSELVTYLLNKPLGYICTRSDPYGRPTVMELVPAKPAVYPVGRLDADSEGLLLLTNDGELAQRMTHPRYGLTKTYRLKLEGRVSPVTVSRILEGVELEDGIVRVQSVQILETGRDFTVVELVIGEGRKRELRRLGKAVGHPVLALTRVAIGNLRDRGLASGKHRRLTAGDFRELFSENTNLGSVVSASREESCCRNDQAVA